MNEETKAEPELGAVTPAWQQVVQAYWQGHDITVECPKCHKQHTMKPDKVKEFSCCG